MATSIGRDIEDIVNCTVCFDKLEDPRMLDCLHYFCSKCLIKCSVDSTRKQKHSIDCPICNKITQIPGGIAGLPRFFWADKFKEILKKIGAPDKNERRENQNESLSCGTKSIIQCLLCSQTVDLCYCCSCNRMFCSNCVKLHKTSHPSHKTCAKAEAEQKFCFEICKQHPDKSSEIYCYDCKDSTCVLCKMTNHSDHTTDTLSNACKTFRDTTSERINNLRQNVSRMQNDICLLDAKKKSENDDFESEKASINEQANTEMEKIQMWKKSALTEIETPHKINMEDIESTRREISKDILLCNETVDKTAIMIEDMTLNNFRTTIQTCDTMLRVAEDSSLKSVLEALPKEPYFHSDMLFNDGHNNVPDNDGWLHVDDVVSDTTVSEDDTKTEPKSIDRQNETAIRLHQIVTDNVIGTVITQSGDLIIARNNQNKTTDINIVTDMQTLDILKTFDGSASSFTSKNGDETVLALPENGIFYLFSLMDWLKYKEMKFEKFHCQHNSTNKWLVLCASKKWSFIVVDPIKKHVTGMTFSSNNKSHHTFQINGRRDERDGRFNSACDLAIGKNGSIVICDTQLARLVVFDEKMKFTCYIALPCLLEKPQALSTSEDGHLYVADGKTHTVKKISFTGEILMESVTKADDFKNPISVHYGNGYLCAVMALSTERHIVELYKIA